MSASIRQRLAAPLRLAALALSHGLFTAPAQAQDCNRDCMSDLITQYVDALAAKDPSRLPLADNVKYTVDGQAARLGEGVWQTVTGKQDFRHDYLDVEKQVAASHVAFWEGENQILYSLLLHIEGRRIAGIETLIQRTTPESRFQPRELGGKIRGMDDPIPEGQQMSRANLVKIALTYTEGLRVGSFTDAATPFAPETYRVENGVIVAQGAGMYEQNIILHPGIIASVASVDVEKGIVLLWMNFGHTGDSYGVGNALVTYEAFKIWGNQIHSINAFFTGLPISRARFWPSADPVYYYH